MEIREQKSPFEACGKDAVQEWLVHPVTVTMRELLVANVARGEQESLTAVRQYPVQGNLPNDLIGSLVRAMGSSLLGLDEALKLFDSAKDYANDK